MAYYLTLDGAEVIDKTSDAILIAWEDHNQKLQTQWIPKSLCQDGYTLDTGDTDIAVENWYANKHGLPV